VQRGARGQERERGYILASRMKCPRCRAAIDTPPDPAGHIVCPGCGIRLRRVPSAAKAEGGAAPKPPAGEGPAAAAASEAIDADKTPAVVRPPAEDLPARADAPPPPDDPLADLDPPPKPTATLPPGSARRPLPREAEASPAPDVLARILAELKALRRDQERILSLLRGRPSAPAVLEEPPIAASAPLPPPSDEPPAALRSRQRKSVLLIDDDETTRRAAIEALERAEVPVRAEADGNSGLASLARDRPDVIVLELGVGGAMPGKDVINLIKATMEWVDIPIVLFTREPVADQREARTLHGADELVLKDGPEAAEALASHIIGLFRKAAS
jgi:CheY-like chemotaxis protein